MDRRAFIAAVGGGIFLAAFAAWGQAAKAHRIGFFGTSSAADYAVFLKAFRQSLRDLGHEEARTLLIEYRWADGHAERLPALAAELVRLKPDILVTHSTPGIRSVQQATTTIPIVFGVSGDPVGLGFVKSLARPGGNTTGVATLQPELGPKRLEVFKEAIPDLRRVAVLLNLDNPVAHEELEKMKIAAAKLALRLQSARMVREPSDLETVFATILRERPDGLVVVADPLTAAHSARIAAFGMKNRLPIMSGVSAIVTNGGLIGYGADFVEGWRLAARYVDKILKGAKPADLPVEQPMKFELVINLKTAKALGLTIPQTLLMRADQVIK
jgi:putative tryptophan/tyrosine transport system substrate-binding protein